MKLDDLKSYLFVNEDFHLPYRLFIPKTENPVPLVVFLHGAGERGIDNERQLFWGIPDLLNYSNQTKQEFAILVPQCHTEIRWVETDWSLKEHIQPKMPSIPMSALIYLLKEIRNNENIDSKRCYLVGISMGGFGVWDLITRKPNWFAAAIPICGGVDLEQLKSVKDLPIWMFHGEKDEVVNPNRSRNAFLELKKIGSETSFYTEYPNVGHNCWTLTFSNSKVWDWLFGQKKI